MNQAPQSTAARKQGMHYMMSRTYNTCRMERRKNNSDAAHFVGCCLMSTSLPANILNWFERMQSRQNCCCCCQQCLASESNHMRYQNGMTSSNCIWNTNDQFSTTWQFSFTIACRWQYTAGTRRQAHGLQQHPLSIL